MTWLRRFFVTLLCGLLLEACGGGGRIGYRVALRPTNVTKTGFYGGPMLWSLLPPTDPHFTAALSGGYMFANRGFGWMGGEAMVGSFPTRYGSGGDTNVGGGGASLLLSFSMDDGGVNFTPAVCGYYLGVNNANLTNGWYFVQGSGCVRWAVNDWVGVDLGSAVAIPLLYAG